MNSEEVKAEVEQRLQNASLIADLDPKRTQFLDLPDGTYAEIVLIDADKEGELRRVLSDLPAGIDLQVHPVWVVDAISDPEIAISPSGGIIAARIVTVTLRSGGVTTDVQVAISWLAEKELTQMLGTEPDLKKLGREYVENLLQWGGQSYWDPKRQSRLEIGAERALSLYRALQKTA